MWNLGEKHKRKRKSKSNKTDYSETSQFDDIDDEKKSGTKYIYICLFFFKKILKIEFYIYIYFDCYYLVLQNQKNKRKKRKIRKIKNKIYFIYFFKKFISLAIHF